jgi:hypothetical protein
MLALLRDRGSRASNSCPATRPRTHGKRCLPYYETVDEGQAMLALLRKLKGETDGTDVGIA